MKIKSGHLFFASLISLSVVFSATSIVSAIGLKSFSTSILSKVEEDEDEEKEYDSKSSLSTSVVSIGSLDNTTFASGSLSKINLNNTASDSLSKVNLYNTTSASGFQPISKGGVELPIPYPQPLNQTTKTHQWAVIKKIDVPSAMKLVLTKTKSYVSRRHLRKGKLHHMVRIELKPGLARGEKSYHEVIVKLEQEYQGYGSILVADLQTNTDITTDDGSQYVLIPEGRRYGYFYIRTYTPEERYDAGARQWENEYKRIDLTVSQRTGEPFNSEFNVHRGHFFVFLGKNY